ncbi:hypothetical protein ACFLRM_06110, partial [Acidobacteriota bacterium]
MKSLKNLLFICLIGLFLISCSKHETAYYLYKEAAYARQNTSLFFVDYLQENAEVHLENGWTKLTPAGTRFGAYPGSKLSFRIQEGRPLYIFLSCKPFKKGKYPARELQIKINNRELAQLEVRENMARNTKISIPPEYIEPEVNVLGFFYETATPPKGKILSPEFEEGKREFSLIFHELILTSYSSYGKIKKLVATKDQILKINKNAFIQAIPGELNFFLDLQARSSFKGRFKYFPIDQRRHQKNGLDFQVSIQQPEGEEQYIYQSSIAGNTLENKL